MEYRFKVWLEKEGQPVLGDGLLHLLTMIRQHGSIRKAAGEMKMSYRQAWGNIKKAEDRLGINLLIKQIGGEAGGGAQLTPEAEMFIERYREFRSEVDSAVRESFRKFFEPGES
ncbi:MAG: molybdenum-binding protein [Firmicutes bacterium HGW-Firmicutes-14]|jgi:molybdate transport system regulatory protein|nr:MAG: molybdenum-binding protein [Firmicutes bacterium HGW-Firmicutes-14]